MQKKIDVQKLRSIISEEVKRSRVLVTEAEQADPTVRAEIVAAASKLLASIRAFEDKATESMMSHVSSHLEELATTLDDMTRRPDAYVDRSSSLDRVVTLKPSQEEDTLV
jgi:hypothetical protein